MKLSKNIEIVFSSFAQKAFNLYFVGGASRNCLTSKTLPYDLDFSTDASVGEVVVIIQSLDFCKGISTHAVRYGTVTCLVDEFKLEFTTTRSDILCTGRAATVEFCKDFKLDSQRRDFTFNAIYFNPISGVILDFHNGLNDLHAGKVNFIGDVSSRIEEDYLRILRYFRFVASTSAQLNPEVLRICYNFRQNLRNLSKERIYCELEKIFMTESYVFVLSQIIQYDIINFLFPKENFDWKNRYQDIGLSFVPKLIIFLANGYNEVFFSLLDNLFTQNLIKQKQERKLLEFLIRGQKFLLTKEIDIDLLYFVFTYWKFLQEQIWIIQLFHCNKSFLKLFIEKINQTPFLLPEEDLILIADKSKPVHELILQRKKDYIKHIASQLQLSETLSFVV